MDELNPYAPPLTNPIPEPTAAGAQKPATRSSRFWASLIDGLIMSAIIFPIMFLTGFWQRNMAAAQQNPGIGGIFSLENLLYAAIGAVIWIAVNWVFLQKGQTLGKRALKIQIVRKDGAPIAPQRIITHRFLPVQIVAQIPIVGGIFTLVDALLIFRDGRNTLHDDIAGTKVIEFKV